MQASRERRERFIRSFDSRTVDRIVWARLCRHGLSYFTDEQLEDVVCDLISDARSTEKFNRINRAIYKAKGGQADA